MEVGPRTSKLTALGWIVLLFVLGWLAARRADHSAVLGRPVSGEVETLPIFPNMYFDSDSMVSPYCVHE
jgi:hypothetical protein